MHRTKRKTETIDFENLPPLPPDALRPAGRKEQTVLKTLTAKNTLLPEDLHFEVGPAVYQKLSLVNSWHSPAQSMIYPVPLTMLLLLQ